MKYMLILLNIILGLLSFYVLIKNKKPSQKLPSETLNLKYYQAGFFIRGKNESPNIILASLVKFLENENISLEKKDYVNSAGKNRENFILKTQNKKDLDRAEEKLFDLLFSFENPLTTKKLNYLRINDAYEFNGAFEGFLDFLEEEMQNLGLVNKDTKQKKIYSLLFLALFDLNLSLISLSYKIYLGIFLFIFALLLVLMTIKRMGAYPPKGMTTYNYYRKMAEDMKKEKNLSMDQSLYALSFGINIEELVNKNNKLKKYEEFLKNFKESIVGKNSILNI
ncbi:DUF2207 domain-containing protein [uncultured Peptoniphilus sp.]|uniref:DUF2207 family protein n=1 Tax=uncultured Peptoniphilus sp. TaxID=254354 RepID=UPI00280644D2|nr:DUF2207 domain-containing protein [uncultured Peptoniphilus sp.]